MLACLWSTPDRKFFKSFYIIHKDNSCVSITNILWIPFSYTCLSKKKITQLSIYHLIKHIFSWFLPSSFFTKQECFHASQFRETNSFFLSVHPRSILFKRLFWNKDKSISATSTPETLDESKESQERCMHADMAGSLNPSTTTLPSRHATCTVFPEESLTREWSRQTGHPNDHASGRAERFSSWRCFWFVDLSCFAVS